MISVLVTAGMILLFLFTGQIIEFVKRLVMFVVDICLRLLSLCGLHITRSERSITTSRKFKETFKEIKIVKKSKENIKLKPSINIFALLMFIVSVVLIIVNLEFVSGCVITNWLYECTFLGNFIQSKSSITVTYTAVSFSILSFSLSKLLSQWKETREIRKTKKQIKQKQKAFRLATSKELLDAAKLRDAERYNQLKSEE